MLPSGQTTEAMLIDLTHPSDKIVFTFMPGNFTESKSAEYAAINILGRSEPVMGYSHSGPRLFNITLTFFADSDPNSEVLSPVQLLRSWVYPDYSSQFPTVPPRLLLIVGQWLSQRVIMLNYNINYMAPWGKSPVSSSIGSNTAQISPDVALENQSAAGTGFEVTPQDSMLPFLVEAQVVLQEVMDNSDSTPWDTNQVRAGQDLYRRRT